MRIESSYPSPTFGISTLAPRTRPRGYAEQQVNFRSDPVNKLTRRPSSVYKNALVTVSNAENIEYHAYERRAQEFSFISDNDAGDIHCFIDDVLINTLNIGNYTGDNIEMFSIEDDTYILNKDVLVQEEISNDLGVIERVSHVNITSALNYSETVTLNIILPDETTYSTTYTVPELGIEDPDYDAADAARATSAVAEELARRIDNGNFGETQDEIGLSTPLRAESLGSSVAIWIEGRQFFPQVEVEAGQGDRTSVAINEVISDVAGLPLYAVVGTRITVRPDPTTTRGTYYLQAERIANNPSGAELEEVVWSEDRNPEQAHSFDNETMPRIISYSRLLNTFSLRVTPFKARQSGDDDSAPFPEFLGSRISTIGYFQKRLVFASDNGVFMTETDDLENWFKQSAVQLLVTDPIGVTTSELEADSILHLVPHSRDLLCITRNSQYKINGDVAITPETVSMPLTTKYECQVSVSPVGIGNSVFFPIDYGDSTGIQEYTGQQNTTQDFALPVTNHIVGYLEGEAEILEASPNLEMIALTTTESPDNVIYIYEQYTEGNGERSQQSWSQWELSSDERVVDLEFRRNELTVVVARDNLIITKSIPLYTRVTGSPLQVYLDDLLILDTDGLSATLPDTYNITGCIAVRGEGTEFELWEAKFTVDGTTITFKEDIGVGKVYIGKTFKSLYEPTRPFRYDEDGSTITTDRIRIGRWILSLVDTHELTMDKITDFSNTVSIKFESRFVGQYQLGTVTEYTGDWVFPFSDDARLATATFSTDNHLGCTIADISWEGQYYQSKQRLR